MERLTQEEYERRFFEIFDSSEYELITPYTTLYSDMSVKHIPCGNVHTKKATVWLAYKNRGNFFYRCDNPRIHNRRVTNEEFSNRFYAKHNREEYTLVDDYKSMNDTIRIRHNVCGATFPKLACNALTTEKLCDCHKGKIVVEGFNSIWDTDPDFVKLFLDQEVAKTHTSHSTDCADFLCPDCKKPIYGKQIYRTYKKGLVCPHCSDGKSFPEKFMYQLLSDHVDIFDDKTFYHDVIFDWSDGRRYDFYFYINGVLHVVETHGGHHYGNRPAKWGNRTNKDEEENDKYKYDLAIKNGVLPENYIVIDCKESSTNYITKHIKESALSQILDLENYDFIKCGKDASSSMLVKACEIFARTGNSSIKIAEEMKLSESVVLKYLKAGTELGLCNYDRHCKRRVRCTNDDIIFESMEDGAKHYGLKDGRHIWDVCTGRRKSCGKHPITSEPLLWEYA